MRGLHLGKGMKKARELAKQIPGERKFSEEGRLNMKILMWEVSDMVRNRKEDTGAARE